MRNLFTTWKQTHKSMPVAMCVTWMSLPCIKSAMLAGYFVLEMVQVVLSPSRMDEINIFKVWLSLSAFCFVTLQKLWHRSSCVTFSQVFQNKQQLELDQKEKQDEKDKQEVEKEKHVTTTLQKFNGIEWEQLYPWLDYKDGKMLCFRCCEYGNLSNASSSFVSGGCTNLKIDTLQSHDISTGHNNVVKANYLSCSCTWPVKLTFCPTKILINWNMDQYTRKSLLSPV